MSESVPQHMRALDRANATRYARSARKKEIHAGGTEKLAELLEDLPPEMGTMTVYDALSTLHGWGRQRVLRVLRAQAIAEHRPLGQLTSAQRDRLVAHLTGRVVSDPIQTYAQERRLAALLGRS